MEEHIVHIVNLESGDKTEIVICEDEDKETGDFILQTSVDDQELYASDYAYFLAYQKLRDKLLALGYGIQCNGSRLNAVQSAMMAPCAKVYLVELGRQALMKDVVQIYDYAELTAFPNTEQQNAFLENWVTSLTSGR